MSEKPSAPQNSNSTVGVTQTTIGDIKSGNILPTFSAPPPPPPKSK